MQERCMTKSAQRSAWREVLAPMGREEKLKREMWRPEKCGGQPRCTSLITCSSSAPPPPASIVVAWSAVATQVALWRLSTSSSSDREKLRTGDAGGPKSWAMFLNGPNCGLSLAALGWVCVCSSVSFSFFFSSFETQQRFCFCHCGRGDTQF